MKAYAKKEGVLVGDPLPHFDGVGVDGGPFDWSVTGGKRVLLIYEGWGYLKRSTHFWFKDLLAATDRGIPTYYYTDRQGLVRRVVAGFDPARFILETGLSPAWGESWIDE